MTDIAVTAAKVAAVFPEKAEIFTFVAGETITAGQAVYVVAASGKVGLADANAAGKQQLRGIALNGGAAGQAINVLKRGHVYGFTLAGDYDSAAYLSDTAGALADAAGTMSVLAGRVVGLSDNDVTKVLHVDVDWLRAWS